MVRQVPRATPLAVFSGAAGGPHTGECLLATASNID